MKKPKDTALAIVKALANIKVGRGLSTDHHWLYWIMQVGETVSLILRARKFLKESK